MKDFNDFKKSDVPGGQSGGQTASGQASGQANGQANNPNTADIAEQFSALASKYEGKNADEIMKAILKEAEKGRKNGTLSDKDIDDFSNMISPMLTDGQRKTLDKVVKRLKS